MDLHNTRNLNQILCVVTGKAIKKFKLETLALSENGLHMLKQFIVYKKLLFQSAHPLKLFCNCINGTSSTKYVRGVLEFITSLLVGFLCFMQLQHCIVILVL